MLLNIKRILPDDNTPEAILDPEGTIRIKGRAISEKASGFFREFESWLNEYIIDPPNITYVDIQMEYFDNQNLTRFLSILKKLREIMLKGKKLVINWYYEEEDDDILERGEQISFLLNVPFNFSAIA